MFSPTEGAARLFVLRMLHLSVFCTVTLSQADDAHMQSIWKHWLCERRTWFYKRQPGFNIIQEMIYLFTLVRMSLHSHVISHSHIVTLQDDENTSYIESHNVILYRSASSGICLFSKKVTDQSQDSHSTDSCWQVRWTRHWYIEHVECFSSQVSLHINAAHSEKQKQHLTGHHTLLQCYFSL